MAGNRQLEHATSCMFERSSGPLTAAHPNDLVVHIDVALVSTKTSTVGTTKLLSVQIVPNI